MDEPQVQNSWTLICHEINPDIDFFQSINFVALNMKNTPILKSFKKLNKLVRKTVSPNLRSVDFIICGTQKGGTSALNVYLRGHPEVCMSDRKELHFFDNEKNFNTKSPDYSKYLSNFSPQDSDKVLGEATPIYMYWENTPRRIWEYDPKIKLIIILRNPIDRAYSHWNMVKLNGEEDLPFMDALNEEYNRRILALPFQNKLYSYIDRGFYMEQLRRIWRYFPKEQVLILKNENLRNNLMGTLDEITEFLQISKFKLTEDKNVRSREYTTQISSAERQFLKDIYEFDIKILERELKWDCSDWLRS